MPGPFQVIASAPRKTRGHCCHYAWQQDIVHIGELFRGAGGHYSSIHDGWIDCITQARTAPLNAWSLD
jgi:hypothetical protein